MSDFTFFGFFASAVCIFSVVSIYRRWRARSKKASPFLWVSNYLPWLGIALAIPLWSQDLGPEFATVIVFLVSGLMAWVCVLYDFIVKERSRTRISKPPLTKNESAATSGEKNAKKSSNFWLKINAFLMAGPLAGVSAALMCLALTQLTNLNDTNKFALSGFMLPVIWALLAVWVCSDKRWWRPTISTVVAGALATVVIQL